MKRLNLEANHNDAMQYIDEKLKVEIQDNSEWMIAKLSSTDPNEATTLIKGLTAAYMGEIVYAEDRALASGIEAQLEEAYNRAASNLEEKKASLDKNIKIHGGGGFASSSSDTLTLTLSQMQVLENLLRCEASRNQAQSDLIKTQAMLDGDVAQSWKSSRIGNSPIRKLKQRSRPIPSSTIRIRPSNART